jgi:hypothetical protein
VISLAPSISASLNAGQVFRTAPGGGGFLGTTTTAAGGPAGTITSQFLSLSAAALTYTLPGLIGGAGGLGNGTQVTWGSSVTGPACGGAAGGGISTTTTDHTGGQIIIPDAGFEPILATIPGGPIATRGQDGICSLHFASAPFYSTGGAGGGSNHGATGGRGGDGAYGSGGGGGGGGATGGAGGSGGDGLIVMAAF